MCVETDYEKRVSLSQLIEKIKDLKEWDFDISQFCHKFPTGIDEEIIFGNKDTERTSSQPFRTASSINS